MLEWYVGQIILCAKDTHFSPDRPGIDVHAWPFPSNGASGPQAGKCYGKCGLLFKLSLSVHCL